MFTRLDSQSLCIYLELLSMKDIRKFILLQKEKPGVGASKDLGVQGSRVGSFKFKPPTAILNSVAISFAKINV